MDLESNPPRADKAAGGLGSSSCVLADDRSNYSPARHLTQAWSRGRAPLFRNGTKSRGVRERKVRAKKNPAPRPAIEISGDRTGERFEAELAAISRALKNAPFIAAGNRLRMAVVLFEPWVAGRSGMVTTRLRVATVDDLRREARKRVRFFKIGKRTRKPASIVPHHHFNELMRRAISARTASVCFAWLRCDLNGRVIASSPPLHFGQTRKFGNG